MTLPKFSAPTVAGGGKFAVRAQVRPGQDRFSAPSSNRWAALKGGYVVPAGPAPGHCLNVRQDAP